MKFGRYEDGTGQTFFDLSLVKHQGVQSACCPTAFMGRTQGKNSIIREAALFDGRCVLPRWRWPPSLCVIRWLAAMGTRPVFR